MVNLLRAGKTVVMHHHARVGTSEKLTAQGWITVEVDGKPFIFEPSKEGVLDLTKLLQEYGYIVGILAGNYIVTTNPNIFSNEAVQALKEHWGTYLLAATQDTFTIFEGVVEELPCRGISGVPSWIRLRWKDDCGFVAQCKHQKMKKCQKCPLRNGKLLEVS